MGVGDLTMSKMLKISIILPAKPLMAALELVSSYIEIENQGKMRKNTSLSREEVGDIYSDDSYHCHHKCGPSKISPRIIITPMEWV